jgi:hypothetical protein
MGILYVKSFKVWRCDAELKKTFCEQTILIQFVKFNENIKFTKRKII